jgi:hypothetical protein
LTSFTGAGALPEMGKPDASRQITNDNNLLVLRIAILRVQLSQLVNAELVGQPPFG